MTVAFMDPLGLGKSGTRSQHQGAEFMGPGWYCSNALDVRKDAYFALASKRP